MGWPVAIACASLLGVGAAFGVYGHFVEPRWLRTRRLRVAIAPLPPSLRGLTILHLSDLHYRKGDQIASSVIRRAGAWGRSVKPDIVCITGDFIENDADIEACLGELGPLYGKDATFAVFGNHDHGKQLDLPDRERGRFEVFVAELVGLPWRRLARHDPPNNDIEHLRSALTNAGIQVLRNENARVKLPGMDLWVAGVDDPHQGRFDTMQAMKGIPPEALVL